MKAPAQIGDLSLAGKDVGTGGAYPPLGYNYLANFGEGAVIVYQAPLDNF